MSEPDNGYAKTISVELFFILLSIKGAYPSEKYLHCKRGLLPCGNDDMSGQWYFCIVTVRADSNSGLPQKHGFCGKREQSPDKRCFCRKAKRAQRRIANAVAGNGGSSAGKAERWNSYGVFLQNTVWNCFKTKKISCTRLSGRVRLNFDIRN